MEDPVKSEFESLLGSLPLLANVAFTARALRRIEPLFVEPDEENPTGGGELIGKAAEIAEQIAQGQTITFEEASSTARDVAGISRKVSEAPSHVAKAAAGAAGTGAIAMGGNPEAATHAMRAAANCARDVLKAADDPACKSALLRDINRLGEIASAENNSGPISSDFFAENLWPDGEPDWFSAEEES